MRPAMTFSEIAKNLGISRQACLEYFNTGLRKLRENFPETLAMLHEQAELSQVHRQYNPYRSLDGSEKTH